MLINTIYGDLRGQFCGALSVMRCPETCLLLGWMALLQTFKKAILQQTRNSSSSSGDVSSQETIFSKCHRWDAFCVPTCYRWN